MDAQHLGCFGLVSTAPFQDTAKERSLELRQSLRVKKPFVDHLPHENLKLAFHETPPGFKEFCVRDSLSVLRPGWSRRFSVFL
jgi:hypothetical protein